MPRRNLNTESDINITNKKDWTYNNYYCTLRYLNNSWEEYDAIGNPEIHELTNEFGQIEGIRIIIENNGIL